MSTFLFQTPMLAIPNAGGSPARYDFQVSVDAKVTDVDIRLYNINHTFLPDLDALLVGPDGKSNLLFMSDVGDGTDLSDYALIFDDAAASSAPFNAAVGQSGTNYRPTNNGENETDDEFGSRTGGIRSSQTGDTFASAFGGLNALGTWSMYFADDYPKDPDVGSLFGYVDITTEGSTATIRGTNSDDNFTMYYQNSGLGNYTLNGDNVAFRSLYKPTVSLGDGNDTAVDNNDSQVFLLGTGDDTMVVDSTTDDGDEYDGGSGIDTLDLAQIFGAVVVDLEVGTLSVGANTEQIRRFENVRGTDFAQRDTLIGNGSANLLEGLGGTDSLRGGGGSDFLDGGSGADTLDGGTGFDVLTGGSGGDLLRASAGGDVYNGGGDVDTVTFATSNAVSLFLDKPSTNTGDALGATFFSIEKFIGSTHADKLGGDEGSNNFHGGNGSDKLYGRDGADKLYGDEGSDQLYGGKGADLLDGGSDAGEDKSIDLARYDDADYGNLVIDLGNSSANTGAAAGDKYVGIEGLLGGVGSDKVRGDSDANSLGGGSGNDELLGRGGNDTLNGGSNTDTASYTDKSTKVVVTLDADGNGTAKIGAETDTLISIENILGGTAGDGLTGGGGANSLSGGKGNDTLKGGVGKDTLTGGADDDRFVFAKGDSGITTAKVDKITDWSSADDAIDTAIAGTSGNYKELSVNASVDTIEEAVAALAAAHPTSAIAHAFLYNATADIGFLLMDLDNNDTFETGLILAKSGTAADFAFADLI